MTIKNQKEEIIKLKNIVNLKEMEENKLNEKEYNESFNKINNFRVLHELRKHENISIEKSEDESINITNIDNLKYEIENNVNKNVKIEENYNIIGTKVRSKYN